MSADSKKNVAIDTGGGSYIEGNINTEGGDFIGRDKHVHLARSPSEQLADYLARAVARYESWMSHRVLQQRLPQQPYKFLYAFDLEDAPIFFGRETAVKHLYETVLSDKVTVLHARSGAGKTSLLNAGLSARLIQEGYLPVYARTYEDPIRTLKQTFAPPSLGPWPELLSTLSLPEFLGQICSNLSPQIKEMVVIFDQFEEFFIFYPEENYRQPFIQLLGDCYDDKALRVRFVMALRTEYFAELVGFQKRLPNIFNHHYQLKPMSREEAGEAITRPVLRMGRQVDYESALLESLLDDLSRGEMELPHLQIVCAQLYSALSSESATITLAAYNAINRAEGILGSYLNEILNKFSDFQKLIAQEILKALVGSEATKRILSKAILEQRLRKQAQLAHLQKTELEATLADLVEARLLRLHQEMNLEYYEVAHDYLAERIKPWLNQDDLRVKQAEELLEREIANWRDSKTYMSDHHLRVITAQGKYLELDMEAQEFLLRSALTCSYEVIYWWSQYSDPIQAAQIATSFLLADDRRHAQKLADALWPEDRALNTALTPLLEQIVALLASEDRQRQQRAREIQVFIGPGVKQGFRGQLLSMQTGLRLLISERWSTILLLALGGMLAGLAAGLLQTGLGLMVGFVQYESLGLILKFMIINEPALAAFGAFIGLGFQLGAVLARGRYLPLQIIGAAWGGATGGFLIAFYFLLLEIMTPTTLTLGQILLDRTLSGAVLASTLVIGMYLAQRWDQPGRLIRNKLLKQVMIAVLVAGAAGFIKDIWLGFFPSETLLAIFITACLAVGLGWAQGRLAHKQAT